MFSMDTKRKELLGPFRRDNGTAYCTEPVKVNDRGVALVSGCSPRIFSMAVEGELNPYDYMLSVICTERYAPITA